MFRAQEDNPYQIWQNKQNGAAGGLQPQVMPDQEAQMQPPPQEQQALNQAIGGYTPISQQAAPQQRGAVSTGGTKGSVAGGALSGAGTGATIGSIVPGVGTALGAGIGAAVGGIKGMFGKKAASAATDYGVNDARNMVGGAYKEFLGRDPSEQELTSQLAGQGLKPGGRWVGEKGLGSVLGSIQNSPEAAAYQAQQAQAPQAAPQAALAQAINGGQAGKGILEGFNNDKLANAAHAEKSPKYAFAAIASKYDQSDPAQRQQMLAELQQNKFFKNATLTGSKGDILDVGDGADGAFGGIRQFDVIRAAGEGGKAWQWGERGGDSGGAAAGGSGIGADYNASGDPILAAVGGQSLNPVTMGMDRLKQLLAGIPGGINGILGGGQ